MTLSNEAEIVVSKLQKIGAHKGQAFITQTSEHELTVDSGEIALLRTVNNCKAHIKAFLGYKQGVITINKSDEKSLQDGCKSALNLAKDAVDDEAYDISDKVKGESISEGDEKPNLDLMHARVTELLTEITDKYPKIIIEQLVMKFTRTNNSFLNSNQVQFSHSLGSYEYFVMFTPKDGDKTGSFNYSGGKSNNLNTKLIDWANTRNVLEQATPHLHAIKISNKFVGDVIITPGCFLDFLGFIYDSISNNRLIAQNSLYKDSLDKQIASDKLSFHCHPKNKTLATQDLFTHDGFVNEDMTVIKNGVLKNFFLDLYGANKTNQKRSKNYGSGLMVDAGDKSYAEMLKNTKKGILLCRFSGGQFSPSGEFSGIAKNSFYIENGEIKYPIVETMVSGNVAQLLMDIIDVSAETINFGDYVLPWVAASGVTVS